MHRRSLLASDDDAPTTGLCTCDNGEFQEGSFYDASFCKAVYSHLRLEIVRYPPPSSLQKLHKQTQGQELRHERVDRARIVRFSSQDYVTFEF